MATVRLLPEQLVNQIAAGEVVERPASVVKELVENALDAGARSVRVELAEGGLRRIRVIDDGSGMSPEDARACLERHATSKLTELDGLSRIATMGFRGEAIPAIASVSRFTLTTRQPGADEGTRITVVGGRIETVEPAGAAPGTTISVEDLFFNTPARRKFMKRPETEAGHVSDAFIRLALARPDIAFTLESGGRTNLSMAASPSDPRERIAAALGSDVFRHLLPVERRLGEIVVSGHVASPDYSMGTQRGIYTYVNRRFVRDRALLAAVQRAFAEMMPPGRFPAAALFIDVPLDTVDVNVHPQKLEVRFADSRAVFEAMVTAIHDGLRRSPWLAVPAVPYDAQEARSPSEPWIVRESAAPVGMQPSVPAAWDSPALRGSPAAPVPWVSAPQGASSAPRERMEASQDPSKTPEPAPSTGYFASLRYLGQFAGTYLVCEAEGPELVLIDQHAAHERQRFHALREAWRSREPRSQALLIPRRVELTAPRAGALADHLDELTRLGFELEPFGGGAFAVKAAPLPLLDAPLDTLLGEIADELLEVGRGRAGDAAMEHLLATMACHSAIRANHRLDPREARALLDALDAVDFNSRCPHGRPVASRTTIAELEREVGRR